MKKWISLIMIMVVLLPTVSFATGGLEVNVSGLEGNSLNGHEYFLDVTINAKNIKKGDSFQIQTPVAIGQYPEKDKDGKEIVNFKEDGDNIYTVIFQDSFSSVNINFGSRQEVRNQEELKELVVNGKVIINKESLPKVPEYTEGNRDDSVSKGGVQIPGSSNIRWSIDFNANNQGLRATKSIVDKTDGSHIIIPNTLVLVNSDTGESIDVEEYFDNIQYDNNGMSFDLIKDISPSIRLTLMYLSDPTVKKDSYSNQIVVQDTQKSTGTARVDWASVTGEHPEEPEEPKKEFIDIEIEKVWKNSIGEKTSGDDMGEITVILLQDGKETKVIKLNPANGWTCTLEDLPKHNEDGSEIKYSVRELEVVGYTSSVERSGNKFTITNTENGPTPPELPQVGEGLFKKEYLIGLVLLALAVLISKQNKTA